MARLDIPYQTCGHGGGLGLHDPDLSESAVLTSPTIRPHGTAWPAPNEVNSEAQSISDRSPMEHAKYKDMV
jgi:hypothetical protein